MSIILILITAILGSASEGTLYNRTDDFLYCYNSTDRGCIDIDLVDPAGTCEGDAIGGSEAVFKIPDNTFYNCDEYCYAEGLKSFLIMKAASKYKGEEHYGLMSMADFMTVMGSDKFCE